MSILREVIAVIVKVDIEETTVKQINNFDFNLSASNGLH